MYLFKVTIISQEAATVIFEIHLSIFNEQVMRCHNL